MGAMLPRTGYAEVDAKFSAAEASMKGFPLRLSLTATRQFSGGSATTNSSSVQTTEIRETTADDSLFVRPTGYRHQQPVVGAPGP